MPGDTPKLQPQGPVAVPGDYTVELSAGGKTYRKDVKVELDPRVKVPVADLQQQLNLERKIDRGMDVSYRSFRQAEELRKALEEREKADKASWSKSVTEAVAAFRKKLEGIQNGEPKTPGFGPVNRELGRLAASVQSADVRPSETAKAAVEENCSALEKDLSKWRGLNSEDLGRLNGLLGERSGTPLAVSGAISVRACGEF